MTTKLAKHTPGPWTFYPDRLNSSPQDDKLGGILSSGEDEWVVAEILSDCDTPETALANAHLIAAAPALLEALEACLGCLQMECPDCDGCTTDPCSQCRAKAAIRAAVGEKEENTRQ